MSRRTFVQQVYIQLSSPVAVWLDDCPCFRPDPIGGGKKNVNKSGMEKGEDEMDQPSVHSEMVCYQDVSV